MTEVQARLTLHAHVAIWGNIPPALMQKAASNENIVSKVAQVLDSQFAAQFPPVIHVKGMLNRIHRNAELYRKPSRMVATTPLSVGLAAFRLDTAMKADIVGVHKDTFTCHKGKHGKRCCRVAQPSGLIARTGPVQISCEETPTVPYIVSRSVQLEDLSSSTARDTSQELHVCIVCIEISNLYWNLNTTTIQFDCIQTRFSVLVCILVLVCIVHVSICIGIYSYVLCQY